MANVLDYLKWRGDLSLDENPFNEVDAMVLARISYIPFDGIVAANFRERILLKEAAEVFLNRKDSTEKILWHTDLEFLSLISASERFGNMELSGYVNQIDEELEKQFCAVTVKMKNQTYYVSYRGTDSTLVGWKESLKCIILMVRALNIIFTRRKDTSVFPTRYVHIFRKVLSSGCYWIMRKNI